MTESFNLEKFRKEAAGSDWLVYRQTGWKWWNYNDLVDGQDPEWIKAVATTPSLNGAFNEITHDKINYDNIFRQRYGVNEQELNQIFFVFLGYHPAYGLYADFIGPYVGLKGSDKKNKYAYFMRRFQKANTNETLMAFNDMLKRNFSEFADVLGPDDFKAVVLNETNERKGTKYWKHERKEYNSVDPNSEDGKKLYQDAPMMGSGTYFDTKPSGIYKIMLKASKDGNLEEALKKSIHDVAVEMGIPDQEAIKMLQTNEEFTKKILNAFKGIQLQAKQMGGPAADQIKLIPDFYVMRKPLIGSQRTDKLKTRPIQFSALYLRKEILEGLAISKIEDPFKLSEFLNLKRTQDRIKKLKAKGQFTPQIVDYWVKEINKARNVKDAKGRFSRKKSYSELLGETDQELQTLFENKDKKEEGFEDLEQATYMCSLFHAEVPPELIDPNTRAKMVSYAPKQQGKQRSKKPDESQLVFVTPPMQLPEGNPIITSAQLGEWRQKRGQEYEGISEEDIEEPIQEGVVGEPVEGEAVDGVEGEEADIVEKPTAKVPFPTPNVALPPKTVAPKTTPVRKAPKPLMPIEEENINNQVPSKGKAKKVMTNTLLSLIRIAKELDAEGKSAASENVHAVIRKYQEGI